MEVPTATMPSAPLEEEEEKLGSINKSIGNFLSGDSATTAQGVPWAMPAALAAGAGGLYGGWKLQDWLMDKQRKQNNQAELDEAREEYNKALLETQGKHASDGIGVALDELYDTLEKKAGKTSDIMGQLTGMYLTLALAGGGVSALGGYNWGKKRQRRVLLEKAKKQRQREMRNKRPMGIQVRPPEVPIDTEPSNSESMSAAPSLDFQEDPLDKESA